MKTFKKKKNALGKDKKRPINRLFKNYIKKKKNVNCILFLKEIENNNL